MMKLQYRSISKRTETFEKKLPKLDLGITSFMAPGYEIDKEPIFFKSCVHNDDKYTEDRLCNEQIFIGGTEHLMMCVVDGHGGYQTSEFITRLIIVYSSDVATETANAEDFLMKYFVQLFIQFYIILLVAYFSDS